MKDLRIVFMGTPDFAVASLEAIVNAGYTVVGVITAPDRPAGRGQKIKKSAVKVFAEKHELTILQPTNLKAEDFIRDLTALKANLQVVVAFRMLPKVVWQMPALGTFNLHASLLPDYRGAAPINWAVINGESTTGVTTFFIDEKIDTGAIIEQKKIAISHEENAGQLHDKLMMEGSELILSTLELIKTDSYKLQEQSKSSESKKTAYKLDRENTRIDWEKPVQSIYNHIRGLSPYPVAWTNLINDEKKIQVKIFDAVMEEVPDLPVSKAGKVHIHEGYLFVSAANGLLKITQLQLAGKRKMATRELINGFSFHPEAHME